MFFRLPMINRQADGVNDGGDNGSALDDGVTNNDAGQNNQGNDTKTQTNDEVERLKASLDKVQKQLDKAAKTQKEYSDKLKSYEGINVEEVRQLLEEKKKAEEDRLAKSGEFDRLKKMMADKHAEEINAQKEELKRITEELSVKSRLINDLTIGQAFNNSKFIKDETVDYFSPTFARKVYGDYFDIQDGKLVAYDKERGASDRTPYVDAAGNPLPFDEAIRKLVDGSNERDFILRSKMKAGADSRPSNIVAKEDETFGEGVERIANILRMRK